MTAETAGTGTRLLQALEHRGPAPVLAWHGEASRIELSGHVLANWVIKSIGHLRDEIALEEGEEVVIDLTPHWKRLVLTLAAWSLGAEVTVLEPSAQPAGTEPDVPGAPRVLVTDRPDSTLAGDADEVLALRAVSLAPRYDGELPALVHDWVAEVRSHPDRLVGPLPAWSGPAPRPAAADGPPVPRLLVDDDGLGAAPAALGAWLAGGGIVGPAASVDPHRAEQEAVTGRA
ncbi:TIGR03089 family protein [Brachybacterium sp. YJGR34]|uniref:TIGR03089 family protein n=1 Tax=Brachybacterium sp. YJGR34 TaxID=2059911 RepID=UPI000E0B95C5|nr:TIGR03089 family protein [Brachybacterium sp. YJGR34]